MKNILLKAALLLAPLLLLVGVNEGVRLSEGLSCPNSGHLRAQRDSDCNWICHNDTDYCQTQHVRYLSEYFAYTDPVYFGIVHGLKTGGQYRLMNIVFLVVLFPLVILLLLFRVIGLRWRIKNMPHGNH